ncbi:MAG: methylated-DNA--[protein]-cysteine S-methyltransferase [Candidatus Bathyarchaeia archaeon]
MINLYIKNVEGVWFGAACDNKKIFATAFASSQNRVIQSLLRNIPFNVPFQNLEEPSGLAEKAIATLKDIYQGKDVSCEFSLAMEHLSSYAQKVLKTVILIPVGYVTSYGSVARAVGGSPRAVGRVMASNPFPLVVPCHRVVASNLSLGGYGGGLQVKLEILRRERRSYIAKREISVDGEKLQIFPVELLLNKQAESSSAFSKRK